MDKDNYFTKDAYEDNGRFQIHPLSSEGLEAYLSKDSYNYHYLKSRYDPALLKQIEEELKEEREQKNKLKNKDKNIESKNNKENPKVEDIKVENQIPSNNITNKVDKNIKDNNFNTKKNNNNINTGVNKGKMNKANNKIQKKESYGNKNLNKMGNIGHAPKPVISNVKNDRGKLKDFQQPYHS